MTYGLVWQKAIEQQTSNESYIFWFSIRRTSIKEIIITIWHYRATFLESSQMDVWCKCKLSTLPIEENPLTIHNFTKWISIKFTDHIIFILHIFNVTCIHNTRTVIFTDACSHVKNITTSIKTKQKWSTILPHSCWCQSNKPSFFYNCIFLKIVRIPITYIPMLIVIK